MNENPGAQLKALRERLSVSAHDVSAETRIPLQYIEAFETWDFTKLEALVYARGFFKKYAQFLNLPLADAMQAFEDTWKAARTLPDSETILKRVKPARKGFMISEKTLVLAGTVFVLIAICGYLVYAIKGRVLPPSINLKYPANDFTTEVPAIDIEGSVDPETSLSVSGRPVYVDEKGNFKERVNLASGVNALQFEAKNKFGKMTDITRYILLKQ